MYRDTLCSFNVKIHKLKITWNRFNDDSKSHPLGIKELHVTNGKLS